MIIRKNTNFLNAIINVPCISLKAECAMKWTNSKEASLAKQLVAWTCVEGIHFSGLRPKPISLKIVL